MTGRAKVPLRTVACASLRALVVWLRGQKERAGLTYAQMAERPECTVTPTTLSRADDGSRLPTWQAARAYAEACGADLVQAERLWCRARYRARQQHQSGRAGSRPETVMDFADLRQAMVELRERCGGWSLVTLSQRAPTGLLPRSTLGAVLRGTALPRRDLLIAFVMACGVQDIRPWERAWDKAAQTRDQVRQADPWHTVVDGNKIYLLLHPHARKDAEGVPSYRSAEGLRSQFRERLRRDTGHDRREVEPQLTNRDLSWSDQWWPLPPLSAPVNTARTVQPDLMPGMQLLQVKGAAPRAQE
ncbi:helix-turn-helix domain-containing protein [Streptomyces sp. NPDC058678]|uniref:helix-turn-helix domain-containing protein n=1 Tax=Streptomyces sp. NPDC058678 TaxID=3346595 RepID=UPI00364802CB